MIREGGEGQPTVCGSASRDQLQPMLRCVRGADRPGGRVVQRIGDPEPQEPEDDHDPEREESFHGPPFTGRILPRPRIPPVSTGRGCARARP